MDKITKNLENDHNYQAIFAGVHVSQTPGIQEHFKKILPEFDRIIEIGTFNGGLTVLKLF